jgi:hypothetical protein
VDEHRPTRWDRLIALINAIAVLIGAIAALAASLSGCGGPA